jgi:hypothetical protein
MTDNVTIFYQGGSGGFALYHYLLLSGQFQHSIEQTWELIHSQFPDDLLTDTASWKTRERWPNNLELKQQSGSQLFLICNPLWDSNMIKVNHDVSDNTHKILLYTSINLQLRMAWEKRAYWFTNISRQVLQAPNSDQQYIRQIKQSAVEFDGIKVDPLVPKIIDEFAPDKIQRLEDFITAPATPDQRKFLNLWTSLQPKKALRLMHL